MNNKMVRKRSATTVYGQYMSRMKKYSGKTVFQLQKNTGSKKGLFKKGRGGKKQYVPKKYRKNVVTRHLKAQAKMPGLEKAPKRRRKLGSKYKKIYL